MTAILNLAVALLAGLLMTRIFSRWHLPDVTAFLVTGVLIGPFVLGRLGIPSLGFASYDQVEALSMISDVAMGFIAFSIGNEFRLSQLKKTGKQAMIIGVLQALAALAFVDVALVIFHFLRPDVLSVPAAITLGAIATATAPATTLMVVRQYKAKGELTDLLLPIVALDDAVGLIAFAVSFGIARAMDSAQFSLASILLSPLIEIVGSLLLGALAGFVLTKLETMFRSNSNRLSLSIAFIFLMVGLSAVDFTVAGVDCGFSPLLVCMMLGTVFCNICPLSDDLMNRADKWSTPMLAVFFVVSGANLRLSVFSQGVLVLIGVVYIIARSAGKYCGARWSAKAVGCDHTVQKYLGIMLLPQEGVALGMCVSAQALGAADPQHHPLLRADLRAGRPAGDKGISQGRRRDHRKAQRSPRAPRAQARRGRAQGIPRAPQGARKQKVNPLKGDGLGHLLFLHRAGTFCEFARLKRKGT